MTGPPDYVWSDDVFDDDPGTRLSDEDVWGTGIDPGVDDD